MLCFALLCYGASRLILPSSHDGIIIINNINQTTTFNNQFSLPTRSAGRLRLRALARSRARSFLRAERSQEAGSVGDVALSGARGPQGEEGEGGAAGPAERGVKGGEGRPSLLGKAQQGVQDAGQRLGRHSYYCCCSRALL